MLFPRVWVLNKQLSHNHRQTENNVCKFCGECINSHETSWGLVTRYFVKNEMAPTPALKETNVSYIKMKKDGAEKEV